MHNWVSLVNGKILHGEDIRRCGNSSLFFRYGSYIFVVFGKVFIFTAAILPAFNRPMHSAALLAMSVGQVPWQAVGKLSCGLNIRQFIKY